MNDAVSVFDIEAVDIFKTWLASQICCKLILRQPADHFASWYQKMNTQKQNEKLNKVL